MQIVELSLKLSVGYLDVIFIEKHFSYCIFTISVQNKYFTNYNIKLYCVLIRNELWILFVIIEKT